MVVENFRLVTPIEWVYRRDLALVDKTLTNPNGTNPLLDGEWLMYSPTDQKHAIRSDGTQLSWVVFAERGRSDVQALGKVPVLYIGKFEADTLVFDATGLAHGNALMVADVTYLSTTRSGLKKQAGGSLTIGYVTRMPSSNGQKLRFFNTLT
jgi:hypothetical protein